MDMLITLNIKCHVTLQAKEYKMRGNGYVQLQVVQCTYTVKSNSEFITRDWL